MNSKDYQTWAQGNDLKDYNSFKRALQPSDLRLLHAAVGLAGESGEVVDIVKKAVFYSKGLDVKHVKEEIGDVCWYIAILLDEIGSSFEEVMSLNREKLSKRYPEGFSKEAAIAQADKTKAD